MLTTYQKALVELCRGSMLTGVKVIEHSISPTGQPIVTFQLTYWRAIHAEMMTHRVFSRNASSSRAVPVKRMLSQVWNNPAEPIHWGANKPGMQADEELRGWRRAAVKAIWRISSKVACAAAWAMSKLGLHKQVANRVLEPYQEIHVVLTATDLENFFSLRYHYDAQPEIYVLAGAMQNALRASTPRLLQPGEWHLPYVTDAERAQSTVDVLKQVSAARCCRVSYLKHDGTRASLEEDVKLCMRLVGSEPLHASPFEHQATPDKNNFGIWAQPQMHGNLSGWIQHRKEIERSFRK